MKSVRAFRTTLSCTLMIISQLMLLRPALGAYEQWQYWTGWDWQTKFLTEKGAEEHMRNGPSWRDPYLNVRGPVMSMSRDHYQRAWTVAPRDPVETAPWKYYTPGCDETHSTTYYGSYEEARDACFALTRRSTCGGMNTIIGESDWITTGDFLGRPRDRYKRIYYDAWLFARYRTPQCFSAPTNPATFSVVATRSVGCPSGFSPDTNLGQCVMTHLRYTYGKPVTTCGEEVGNPCDVANGSKLLRETDYSAPGIEMIRSFNSQAEWHWRHNFSGYLVVNDATALGFVTHSGHHEPFRNYGGAFVAYSGSGLEARRDGEEWVLYYPSGARDRFDVDGRLLGRENAAGQLTRVVRDAGGNIEKLIGPFGHTLSFRRNEHGGVEAIIDPAGQPILYDLDALGRIHAVTYQDGTSRHYHYENTDFPQLVTGITDENGERYATYAYDENGRAAVSEHAGGLGAVHLSYTADTTLVTDAEGHATTYRFTDNPYRLRKITSKSMGGSTRTYRYPGWRSDNQQRPSEVTDERGIVTHYVYDTHHKTREVRSYGTGQARTLTFAYLDTMTDRPTTVTSPSVYAGRQRTVDIRYDGNGLTERVEIRGYTPGGDPVTRSIGLEHDDVGQLVTIDGPREDVADVTRLSYHDCREGGHCGQLASITNALGHRRTFDAYDAHGRLTRTTAPNGLVTDYTYDLRGRLRAIEESAEGLLRRTAYVYDDAGLLRSVEMADGGRLHYEYDAAHQLVAVRDASGHAIEYGYDLNGNLTGERTADSSGALAAVIQYVYDAHNRIETINAPGSVTRLTADALGNLTGLTDPNGNVTTHRHDPFNRLMETIDALSGTTEYAYDSNDAPTSVRAPNGAETAYSWDDLGNLLSITAADTGTTTLTHDAAGNVLSRRDADGGLVRYGYDALNRLTTVAYADPQLDIVFSYDGEPSQTGRLTMVSDAAGTTTYEHDVFGNLTRQQRLLDGHAHVTEFAWDPMNRLQSIGYPSGRRVDYRRDTSGRITAVETTYEGIRSTVADSTSYAPFGPLTGLTFGNGLRMERSFDSQYRLLGQVTGAIQSLGLVLDAAGNVDAIDDLAAGTGRAFTQDALHRLDSERAANSATVRYRYDGAGNRLERHDDAGISTQRLSYAPASNRLATHDGATVLTDAAGNTVLDAALGLAFEYAANDRPVAVTVDGQTRATFVYDAQGHRVGKTETSGEQRSFVFHYGVGGLLLGESIYDASGALLEERDYVWLDALPIAQARISDAGPADSRSSLVYLHADHLLTPRLASNELRTVVWRWDSDAFGLGAAATDPDGDGRPVDIPLRFPGQYADEESGLHYNYFRDYAPRLGRYTQSDPIGLLGGLNTYGYANQNPVAVIDPSGEFGVIGGAYGAVSGAVGGYISSGGTWRGAAYGALAGGSVGFVNPLSSHVAGLAAGSALASIAGQAVGLADDACRSPFELGNYSLGAVAGAGLGGPIGSGLGRISGALIDPIRRNLIGRSMTSPGLSRLNQGLAASVLEGSTVGTSEVVGNAIFPARSGDDGLCGCR